MTSMPLLLGALSLFCVAAAYTDWRTGLIPNRLIVAGLVAALALHVWAGYIALEAGSEALLLETSEAVLYSFVGLFVCGLTPLVLFRLHAMGGGDVKLLAVLGAFVGPVIGMEIQLNAFLVMALFVAARFAYRGDLLRLLGGALGLLLNPFRSKAQRALLPAELMAPVRFAPAVLVAALLVFGVRFLGSGILPR